MQRLLDLTPAQLAEAIVAAGEPKYRAGQILDWIWKKHVYRFEEMTNLPAALRSKLAERFSLLDCHVEMVSESPDGTTKLLLRLADGETTETVLIPTDRRATACVSVQVGCPIGCAFCASGQGGLKRNLSSGEILQQALLLQDRTGRRVSHVVFMGMGEPLLNLDAVEQAVRAMADPKRMGISARHISVSTVGLPDAIRRLAAIDLPITLAISLHAPTEALRRRLIPAARSTTIDEIVAAANEFFAARKREVTLEYVVLSGVNDSPACIEALARIASRLRCAFTARKTRVKVPSSGQRVPAFG